MVVESRGWWWRPTTNLGLTIGQTTMKVSIQQWYQHNQAGINICIDQSKCAYV